MVQIAAMFEVTAADIALLNDEDLRGLVGLLCEAEVRRLGLPTSHVTWGGNQDAGDGGLDVRVALPSSVPRAGSFRVRQLAFRSRSQRCHVRRYSLKCALNPKSFSGR